MSESTVIEQILELARWAPSGDNTQPWRFEIVDARQVVIHGRDTRREVVYDLDGHPSQIALGALLETLAIAASGHGWRMVAQRRCDMPDEQPTFDVRFEEAGLPADPLIGCIQERSVQRRPFRTRPLTPEEKQALEATLRPAGRVLWLEGGRNRWRAARLMFENAELRLTIPEAYEVHRHVIEWNARYSEDRVPDQALGVDLLTTKLMRRVMQSWARVEFFNRWLGGTLAPRIQMDFLPGLACAGHFVLIAEWEPQTTDDYVAAGRMVQRFWLTACRLGLQLQPEMTPLIFARYVREGRRFTVKPDGMERARNLVGQLENLIGRADAPRAVFMGRIGEGKKPRSRSLRLPLAKLLVR